MNTINGFEFIFGNQQQSDQFLILKMVICAAVFFPVIIGSSLKNVNDTELNGAENKDRQFSKLGWLTLTIVIWLVGIFAFAGNLDSLINPKLNSEILGMCVFGTWAFAGLFWAVSAWWILIVNIKKSSKTPEEKRSFYLENNRTWNAGITGLLCGVVGLYFVVAELSIKLYPNPDGKFHITHALMGLIIIMLPFYLIIKVPKWVRKYAERFL
jgi:hypothetical protein